MRVFPVFLLGVPLLAHDLYLRPEAFRLLPGAKGTVAFHNGDEFPSSQGPPVLARVRDVRVSWAGGSRPMTGLRANGRAGFADFVAPPAAGFLLTAHTVPNFIELPATEFEKYLAGEGLEWVIEWRKQHGESARPGREVYSKYVKSILHTGGADPFVCRPAGQLIEFVPAEDPSFLNPGQRLRVVVLHKGVPAANVHVEASFAADGTVCHRQLGRTDTLGRIEVLIEKEGLWKLHAIRMERRFDRWQADWESSWASLTFEVSR